MQTLKLKVGSKKSGDVFAVQIEVGNIPSTFDELTNSSLPRDFIVAKFVRGLRIDLQDQSQAREYVSSLTVEQRKDIPAVTAKVAEIVAARLADPTAKPAGRPATPREVIIPETVKLSKNQIAEMQKVAAAQGFTLTIK